MNRLLASLAVASTAATIAATTAPAVAYPIDCAILLCMAGGFPPSAECAAAKAEVIRRITLPGYTQSWGLMQNSRGVAGT